MLIWVRVILVILNRNTLTVNLELTGQCWVCATAVKWNTRIALLAVLFVVVVVVVETIKSLHSGLSLHSNRFPFPCHWMYVSYDICKENINRLHVICLSTEIINPFSRIFGNHHSLISILFMFSNADVPV